MQKSVTELSPPEFEELVERAVDRRLGIWLTQLVDALSGDRVEDDFDLRPEFAESLRRALKQSERGEGIELNDFKKKIAR